jgi:hypothetical protein
MYLLWRIQQDYVSRHDNIRSIQMVSNQAELVAGFYPSDDPRSYRHATNANPGQAQSRLTSTANRWLHARIVLEKKGPFTHVIPEVYVEDGDVTVDPSTGVPSADGGKWLRLFNARTGLMQERRVISLLPFSKGRLVRGIKEIGALFAARALVAKVKTSDGTEVSASSLTKL